MARYFYLINNQHVYIYFTKLLGGIGVIENIKKRMLEHTNEEVVDKVFNGLKKIPIGASPEEMPAYTKTLVNKIYACITEDTANKILAGNNHSIPKESLDPEKEFYKRSDSIEQYLAQRHIRKVNELQEYCDAKKVWFEQVITQPVVDYVKSNQEILSAVKHGNKLYVTKIPYDTEAYLNSSDDTNKKYHAFHCPFVREAILSGLKIDSKWCYCSAGFAKYPFEVILEKELEVKVLESVLSGGDICRFEITLK